MNKETQTFYNLACNSAVDLIERNVTYNWIKNQPCRRLRSCQAWVYTFNFFDRVTDQQYTVHALRSYNTIVCFAIYNPSRDKMYFYDILRRVYGFTATSAQHIAKFKCDYSIGKTLSKDWQDSHNIYVTWRAI